MVLTIGVFVKDDTKKLKDCLLSISSLIRDLKSELIVVTTGSNDEVKKIASEYTRKIRHFDWCDDFSAARNETLKWAKGEWYMFVDSDEVFDDCTEIKNFFATSQYKEYNSATYIQRNYTNMTRLNLYNDEVVTRLVKRSSKTKFVGIVNETIEPVNGPVKHFDACVHHYGFAKDADSGANSNILRKIELLHKKINLEPDNMITYIELFDAYLYVNIKEGIKCCFKGLEVNKKRKHDKNKRYYDYVFWHYLVDAYFHTGKMDKAKKYINIYFTKRSTDFDLPKVITSDISAYALKTILACKRDVSQIIVTSAMRYNELYAEFNNGLHRTFDYEISKSRFLKPSFYLKVNGNVIETLCLEKRYEEAAKFRAFMPYNDIINNLSTKFLKERIANDITIATNLNDDTIIEDTKNQLKEHQSVLDTFEMALFKSKHGNIKIHENMKENNIRLFYDDFATLPIGLADLIYIVIKKSLPVAQLIKIVDINSFDKYFNAMKNKDDLLRAFMAYFEVDHDNVTEEESIWLARLAYYFLVSDVPMNDMMIVSVFVMYSSLMMDYMAVVYKDSNINEDNISTFSEEIQIGFYSYYSAVAFDDGDAKKCVDCLRKAALRDSKLTKAVIAMENIFKFNSDNQPT